MSLELSPISLYNETKCLPMPLIRRYLFVVVQNFVFEQNLLPRYTLFQPIYKYLIDFNNATPNWIYVYWRHCASPKCLMN